MGQPINIFISYSHRDSSMKEELEKHLSPMKRLGQIQSWHDGLIDAGGRWEEEIHRHLTSAQIVILLISPDFVASDYCYHKEMWKALQLHIEQKLHIIPIILRPVLWEQLPFSFLQALPSQGRPITLWTDRDAAFLDVTQAIYKTVETVSSTQYLGREEKAKPNESENQHRCNLGSMVNTLETGHSYNASVLWILVDPVSKGRDLLSDFFTFSAECLSGHGGIPLHLVDGWAFLFLGESRCEQAAMAGAHLLDNLPNFIRNSPDGTPLEVRIIVHDTVVEYKLDLAEIPEQAVFDAMADSSLPGELCISSKIQANLKNHLQKTFSYKGKAAEESIFGYSRLPYSPDMVLKEAETLAHQALVQRAQLKRVLDAAFQTKIARLEKARTLLDNFYLTLERIRFLASRTSDDWTPNEIQLLVMLVEEFLAEELALWEKLSNYARENPLSEWSTIRQVVGSRRSYGVTVLGSFADDLRRREFERKEQSLNRGQPTAQGPSLQEIFLLSVEHFGHADELEEEALFAGLLLEQRSNLVHFIQHNKLHPARDRVIERLWKLTDLVLIEDLTANPRLGHFIPQVFPALTSEINAGGRFSRVQALFQEYNLFGIDMVEERFPHREDLDIALKCLMISHPNQAQRRMAAQTVQFDALWRTVAYPRAPIILILEGAKRLVDDGTEDTKKIFFDCVRGNIVNHLNLRQANDISHIQGLIDIFFSFPFFIEDLYFERLDDLLLRFLEVSRRLDKQADYFIEARRTLDQRRQQLGNPAAKLPNEGELKRVPLAVQRKLARDGCYLDFFVLHPDARIAKETLRHIKPHDAERILKYRNINHALMLDLLLERKYFKSEESIEAALNNPKCNSRFAQNYLSSRSLSQLKRLAFNVNANAQIRQFALKEAVNRSNCDVDFARSMLGKLSLNELSNLIGNPRSNAQVRRLAIEILRSR